MIRKWIWTEDNTFSGDSFAHQGKSTSPAEKLKTEIFLKSRAKVNLCLTKSEVALTIESEII